MIQLKLVKGITKIKTTLIISLLFISPNQGSTQPSAFLNYILFDDSYVPLKAESIPVGSAGARSLISIPQINVEELGYVFIYLSYDNESTNYVYFDDFKIKHTESPVIQVNAYYPFGMAAYSWTREGETENKYLYQGKEYDDKTQWHDFHARQYDAILGRWLMLDDKGGVMPYNSPYVSMMNNPIMYTDPDGNCPICFAVFIGMMVNTAAQGAAGNINSDGDFWKAIAIGGASGAAGYGAGSLLVD